MYWKITNLSIKQELPETFFQTLSGSTFQPQNLETNADITITFRDAKNITSLEHFEEQMKSANLIYEGEEFTREEIEKALQQQYPERFI
jgi:hypothetical protein